MCVCICIFMCVFVCLCLCILGNVVTEELYCKFLFTCFM